MDAEANHSAVGAAFELRSSVRSLDCHRRYLPLLCPRAGDPYNTNAFRDSILTYVHYYPNASIAPVVIDAQGVGSYNATAGAEAENYMRVSNGGEKVYDERAAGGFAVRAPPRASGGNGARFRYPNVRGIPQNTRFNVRAANTRGSGMAARVHARFGDEANAAECTALVADSAWTWIACEREKTVGGRLPEDLHLTLTLDEGVSLDAWRFN